MLCPWYMPGRPVIRAQHPYACVQLELRQTIQTKVSDAFHVFVSHRCLLPCTRLLSSDKGSPAKEDNTTSGMSLSLTNPTKSPQV